MFIAPASSEGANEASSDLAALKSGAALALNALAALKPRLADWERDIPGDNEGSPTIIASKLFREARQAQGISIQTKFKGLK